MSRLLCVALVGASLACNRSPAPTAPVSVPPPPIVAADVASAPEATAPAPPDVAVVASDAAASPDGDTDDPRFVRVRALAAGTAPLADAIDAARGVFVVRHIEPPPSGRGRAQISDQRLCGEALTRALGALQRDLAAAVEQAGNEPIVCGDEACVVPGMEYQPAWRIYLAEAEGTYRLYGIAQLSLGAVSAAWSDAAFAHVDRVMEAARQRPCPPVAARPAARPGRTGASPLRQ